MTRADQALSIQDFINALEPVIRRIVREELNVIAERHTGIFQIAPESPLHAELTELKARNERGGLELLSHEEVWK